MPSEPHQIVALLPSSFNLSGESKAGFTFGAEVIHQQNLLDKVWRRAIEDTVHGPQESGPHLIYEAHDDAGGGECVVHQLLCTPEAGNKHR